MEKKSLLVGLDIGTTNVKAVAADTESGELRVIGAASEPTKGMRHGKIVDIDQTAASIEAVLKKLAEKVNAKIYRVVTGIPVGLLRLEKAKGLIAVNEQGQEVDDKQVKRVLARALQSSLQDGQEAIAFLPSKFLIDGRTDVVDPRKMIAHSLEVYGVILTAPMTDLHNINTAIQRAGYENDFFVPTPMAISSVALDEGERNFGTVILDFGGGTTTATVIHDNKIKYAMIDLEGGYDITHDISVVLNTSESEAEKIKRQFGYAEPELANKENHFPVRVVGQSEPQAIDEEYLSEIINARLEQILDRVGKGLDNHNAFSLPGGIVITGGESALQGIDDLTKDVYDVKVRIFQPDQMGLRNPIYAASFGIVKYAYNFADIDYLINSVIYGTEVETQAEADEKKGNFLQRRREASGKKPKVAYNKGKSSSVKKNETPDTSEDKDKKNIFSKFKDFVKDFFE